MKPAPLITAGTGLEMLSSAASISGFTPGPAFVQPPLAVTVLARRFGLAPSTASAVALANGWGGAND